jgi:hypothetical protein
MAVVYLESFDNPAYSTPADLVTSAKWQSQSGIALGESYAFYGINGVYFNGACELRSKEFGASVNPLVLTFRMKVNNWASGDGAFLHFYTYANQGYVNFRIYIHNEAFANWFRALNTNTSIDIDYNWHYYAIKIYCEQSSGYCKIYQDGNLILDVTGDTQDNDDSLINSFSFVNSSYPNWPYQIDGVAVVSTSGIAPIDILGENNIAWNGSEDTIVYAWTEPEITDNLGSLNDTLLYLLNTNLDYADNLANLSDAVTIELLTPLTLDLLDDLNNWLDEVESATPLALDFGDTLSFSDESGADFPEKYEVINEDLNFLQDGVETEFAEKERHVDDTFSFSDTVLADFRERYASVVDTLVFSDAVMLHLDVYLAPLLLNLSDNMLYNLDDVVSIVLLPLAPLTVTISDNNNNLTDGVNAMPGAMSTVYDDLLSTWSDTVKTSLICTVSRGDQFTLYDSVKLYLTLAKALSDTLVLSDAISVKLSVLDASLSESMDLWNDLVAASLASRLEILSSDTMAQTDTVTNDTALGEDISYYRRYLNDVIS